MHSHRKSLRGVTIINEASIKFILQNMSLFFFFSLHLHDWETLLDFGIAGDFTEYNGTPEHDEHHLVIEPVNQSFSFVSVNIPVKFWQSFNMPVIFLFTVVCVYVHLWYISACLCVRSLRFSSLSIPLFLALSSVRYSSPASLTSVLCLV